MIPPEIWRHILSSIPRLEQPKLLEVSHLFHDIALELVFSAVKIYFIGGKAACSMLSSTHDEFVTDTTSKLMNRSWEILRYITQEPHFAKVVKSISVVAFSDSQSIFEKLCLVDALNALPNLRTFRWFGTSPGLSDIIAEHLSPNIQTLVLQTYVPPLPSIKGFSNITHLTLPTPFFYPDDEEAHDDVVVDESLFYISSRVDVAPMFSTASPQLQSLSINAVHVPEVPVRILNSLKELELCVTTPEVAGLDFAFRHATALESLTLAGYLEREILTWLPTNASELPSLRSFRLSCDNYTILDTDSLQIEILCLFLRTRTNLRRLYIRLPSIFAGITTSLVLEIKDLQGLEVLGLHTGTSPVIDDDLAFLSYCLPPRLKALHLTLDWAGSSLLPLIDNLAKLPDLSFLHLYGVSSRLPLLLVDVATDVKGLQMVGLNRALWDIDRTAPELELVKWPRWKIKFCMPEDFLCDDDAWLFKYN